MNGYAYPAMVAFLAVATGAWAWHACAEHHWHLIIARKVNPAVVVPATRHDAMWHAMSHGRRLLIDAAMAGAAVGLGVSWHLEQTATAFGVIIALALFTGWLLTRVVSKTLGRRGKARPDPELED